jgi:uracil-DNA glycosylase family 4
LKRRTELEMLAQLIRACRRCPGLNIPAVTEAAPGYGDPASPVFLVGQSLCEPCMQTQIPFTGGSGVILDRAFQLANVRKEQLFITNVVHCHPPNNRPSRPEEIENCSEYLQRELTIVQPRLIIGLGRDAENWLSRQPDFRPIFWSPHLPPPNNSETIYLFVYHPSYILRLKEKQAETAYIERLAHAITWAFTG